MTTTIGATTGAGSAFWQFSLRTYRDPKVQAACLALQDEAQVDVNVLLFMLWLGTQGRELTVDDVGSVVNAVEPWRASVVVPLRMARRALKEPAAVIEGKGAEALRLQVKRAELESERLQQEALFALAAKGLGRAGTSAAAATAANVAHYATALGQAFPAEHVATMLAAAAA